MSLGSINFLCAEELNMDQVGQRKIDGMWLTVVGIAVLFFLILPTLIVILFRFLVLLFWSFHQNLFHFDGMKPILVLRNG